MSRYFGHVLIDFMDGRTDRVGGNRTDVHEGQLIVKTVNTYGGVSDVHWFPLVNIRSYRWED